MPFLLPLVATMMFAQSASYYPVRLEDAKAVYLTPDHFRVQADGVADDTEAIQRAIDRVQETTTQGIVFIPSGRYRISNTICVWPGVRVIGFGPTRPTFVLGDGTPGYQAHEKYMVFFAGRRPAIDAEGPPSGVVPPAKGRDDIDFAVTNEANPGTFYSAMSNVDFEIGGGNPSAVAIRGRYAQHCYLAHMDFRLGSAWAGIHDTGNEAHDLHFHGGQYGIVTRTPSPGWQFTLIDSSFDHQTVAAIRTNETGLTLIRPSFLNVPSAIAIDPGHTEQLWIKDGRMEDIAGPAVLISREKSLRLQLNMENVVCRHVPVFAEFRDGGRQVRGVGDAYAVRTFSHGFSYPDLGATPEVKTVFDAERLTSLPAPVASDVPSLPPAESWINIATMGAKGDGTTDDTAILKAAIAKYPAIYLPSGRYRVTDTIALRPDTVLIGLNPITTQIVLADSTPGFSGPTDPPVANSNGGGNRRGGGIPFPGGPKPLLEAPMGGTNIVTGIGLDTGGINPSAVGAKWMAGATSMMDDVKFLGGHGSSMGGGFGQIYNNNNTADPNAARRWDSQFPSLWVTNGGGGTFKNIWTASTFAQAGMAITDTRTPGRVYQLSSEHHVRHEVQIRNAANWEIVALQTEEERGESPFALPLEIENCENILVANLNMYRVVSVTQPFPYAVKVSASRNVRFRNVHCYSNSKASFDSLLFDADQNYELRQREFACLTLSGHPIQHRHKDARVERLAGGIFNISGGAVHPNGDFYFVDARWQRIYRWNEATRTVSTVQDGPLSPTNLWIDGAGNVMVVSYAGRGTVYTFNPDHPGELSVLKAEPARDRTRLTPVFPVTDWQLNPALVSGAPMRRPFHFVSPDGTTFLPVGQDFIDGALTYGIKLHDVIRSFGLAKAIPGQPFYVMGESEARTYAATVEADGTLSHAKLFAEQGGEGLAVDRAGNVYVAAGQIYVYSPAGKLIDTIEVPERPTQLAFGGKDGKTLYITARTTLYAVRIH